MFIFAVIVFPALFFIGNNVIANENRNVADHKEMRQEADQDRKEISSTLNLMAQQLSSINMEMKYLRKNGRNTP